MLPATLGSALRERYRLPVRERFSGTDENFDGKLQKSEFFMIAQDKDAVRALKDWGKLQKHERVKTRLTVPSPVRAQAHRNWEWMFSRCHWAAMLRCVTHVRFEED